VTIDVLANDKIGSKINITTVSIPTPPDPTVGTAVVNADNTVTFSVAQGAISATEATFEYEVCYEPCAKKGKHSATETVCKTALVTVFIRSSDSAPTAVDDTASTSPGVSVLIDVLFNDTDPDSASPGGAGLTITNVTTPNQGTAAIEDGQIRYTPPDDTFTGDATFQYTITDSCGNTATATVTVTVGTTDGATAQSLAAKVVNPLPALVLLVNNSGYEITVSVGGQQVDVVQPLASTVVPASVASGDQSIKVEALLPAPDPARETSSNFTFSPEARYTITYTDDSANPASISVGATP
jgi:hypothetical protein